MENEPEKFSQNFIDILSSVRSNWGYEVFNVTHQIFPNLLDKFDGIIITGSPASANDKNLWIEELLIIIRNSIDKKIPMISLSVNSRERQHNFVNETKTGYQINMVKSSIK